MLLLIDKPKGITSHDVVDKVRKITGEKRVGHAGTLDPNARGLLIVRDQLDQDHEIPVMDVIVQERTVLEKKQEVRYTLHLVYHSHKKSICQLQFLQHPCIYLIFLLHNFLLQR